MLLLGGHMGPPLRRMGKMGRGYLTYFVILMPTIRQKMGVFCSNAEESVYALCWYFIVGADLCVRPG